MTPRLTRAAVVAAGAVLSLALTGWFGLIPTEPLSFHGDHLLTLGNARSYIDGNGFRWNDRLGFPGTRDAMYHATFYFAQKSIMWLTARVVERAPLVVYVFYGAGIVLLFGAAYWSLRRLGIGTDLAWIGGVAFVITPYVAVRSAMHDMLAIPFSVPIGVLLAVRTAWPDLVSSRHAREAPWRDPLSWWLIAVVGTSGLYYAFFTAFFVSVFALAACVWRRTIAPMAHAAFACMAVVCVLLATGPGTGLVDAAAGRVSLTERRASDQHRYGLVLADATTTFSSWPSAPEGVVAGMARLGWEGTWGEWPGPALTTVVFASPLLAIIAAIAARRRRIDERRAALVIISAIGVVAAVAFSVRGGLGAWFNEWVTPAIRAQNRVTPFLAFFAIVVLTSAIEGARAGGARRHRWWWACGLAAVLLASAWPAAGFLHTKQQAFLANDRAQAGRQSIEHLLHRVRETGVTTVLQLPLAAWPEVPPIRGIDPYRFELPHILSRAGSPVRWSYGLSNRQREFRELTRLVNDHREEGLAAGAAAMGFDAILLDKRALGDDDLSAIDAMLARELPMTCRLFDDSFRVLWKICM